MKSFLFLLVLFLSSTILLAQRQLDVQGSATSGDTVATIRVNYDGSHPDTVVALYVKSQHAPGWFTGVGVAGIFEGNLGVMATGSDQGVLGISKFGSGIKGESKVGYGVYGYSESLYGVRAYSYAGSGIYTSGHSTGNYGILSEGHTGGFFKGFPIAIELGGSDWFAGRDDGVIASLQDSTGSDIFLVANDAVVIELDNDKNSFGTFEIWNQDDLRVLEVDEGGNLELSGTLNASDVQCDEVSVCLIFQETLAMLKSQQEEITILKQRLARFESLTKRLGNQIPVKENLN